MAADTALQIEERDSRVAEWLDDKLQTLADLDTLDALLQDVRTQQLLLREQLHDANRAFHDAKKASHDHRASLQAEAQRFSLTQRDIDRRVAIMTQSETSDDAVTKFEASMSKLRRLDIAEGYVRQLQEVDRLSQSCLSFLGMDDAAALQAYHRMHDLASSLPALQDAAEGAAPHLVDYVLDATKQLHSRIESGFSSQFEDVLRAIQWPMPGQTLPAEHEATFKECVGKLLAFQKPDLEASLTGSPDAARSEPPMVLLPLQVMVRPLELAFRYHYDTDRPTNRLERPEQFLSHVTEKLLVEFADFMLDNVQPILSEALHDSDVSLNPAYGDATSALITALLPMVRNKVFSILPRVAKKPQLLSHLIHELMAFDQTLRDEWNYDDGCNGNDGWRGLTYEVLSTEDWFNVWLNVEKDFAIARYEKIVEAPDSKDLDFDALPRGVTTPTKAAIRVNDLLEATTDNYRTLSSFSHKLRFLIDIQLSIFDRYHAQLLDHLNAYQIRNTRIGRTSKEEQIALQGIQGLETLCKIYGSAEYLEKAMRDWSDDVFFLDMWTELQARADGSASKQHAAATVAQDMTLAQVAGVTSQSLGTEDGALNGAMFDETAAAYQRLRVRCENILVELVQNQVRRALEPYTRINPWATLSEAQKQPLPSTAELDPLLTVVKDNFTFLSKALGKLPLRKVVRAAAHAVDDVLFDRVLLVRSFSAAGAAQLAADISAVHHAFEAFVDASVPELALRHVTEGAALVGLPIKSGKGEADVSQGEDDGFEDDDTVDRRLGLWEVEKKLLEASGDVAKLCLAELGIEKLAVHEARKVIVRRVELSS
ncbi:uncharacterized protein PV09_05909 [Verruconis gallopava]|uniref:RINT-1 family protein n=1 Tax=Verruconis gallopava TaxID=253628 RepID=A0A0D2A8D3_9PEZI|nr:uncharacterized protein PV09_05909 [Verruconis gallopava]KIW02855.1 hypothetical protein PV09_05909 [Verruconis gallopava]